MASFQRRLVPTKPTATLYLFSKQVGEVGSHDPGKPRVCVGFELIEINGAVFSREAAIQESLG